MGPSFFYRILLWSVFSAILLYAGFWSFSYHQKIQSGQKNFEAALANNLIEEKSEFSFPSLTNFEWDTVCQYDYGWDALSDLEKKQISPGDHQRILQSMKDTSDMWIAVFIRNEKVVSVFYDRDKRMTFGHTSLILDDSGCTPRQKAVLRVNY